MESSSKMFSNKTLSVSIDNVDLHFVVHHESFSQSQSRDPKAFHSHVYFEILYSPNGSNTLFLKERKITLGENSFAVVSPYLEHRVSFENAANLFSIGFYYEKNQCKHARNDYEAILERLFSQGCYVNCLDAQFRELFLRLRETDRNSTPLSEGVFLGILMQILFGISQKMGVGIEVCDFQSSDAMQNARKPYSPQGNSFHTLYQINEVLNAKYTESITPISLSEQFYISPKQINRYILKQYGQTFLQRRTALRMEAAQKRLEQTNDSIASICTAVGYASINTFYSAFKAHCGMPPDAYRKQSKQS